MSKTIEIILITDVPGVGKTGDLVKAKAGFARNYLLPKKLAVLENSPEAKVLQNKKAEAKHQINLAHKKDQAEKESLTDKVLTLKVKVNQKNKPFKSVQKKEIAKLLKVTVKELDMEPLKDLGKYTIKVGHGEKKVPVIVDIVPEK